VCTRKHQRKVPNRAVVEGLPLSLVLDERRADVPECGQLIETTQLIPGLSRQPRRDRVTVSVGESDSACQQKPPLVVVDAALGPLLLLLLQNVDAKNEREQQL